MNPELGPARRRAASEGSVSRGALNIVTCFLIVVFLFVFSAHSMRISLPQLLEYGF